MSDPKRFFDLLPFRVNRTIGADDDAWLQRELDRNPGLTSQVALMQALREAVRDESTARVASVAPDIGFDMLRARLAEERRTWPWQRLRAWLDTTVGHGRLVPGAYGLAFGVMLGVALMVPLLQTTSPVDVGVRSSVPGLADGPLLRVTFKPGTRERDLRLALIDARAIIVAGPTRLGDYYLKTPANAIERARALLQDSALTLRIDEVPSLPPDLLE